MGLEAENNGDGRFPIQIGSVEWLAMDIAMNGLKSRIKGVGGFLFWIGNLIGSITCKAASISLSCNSKLHVAKGEARLLIFKVALWNVSNDGELMCVTVSLTSIVTTAFEPFLPRF